MTRDEYDAPDCVECGAGGGYHYADCPDATDVDKRPLHEENKEAARVLESVYKNRVTGVTKDGMLTTF